MRNRNCPTKMRSIRLCQYPRALFINLPWATSVHVSCCIYQSYCNTEHVMQVSALLRPMWLWTGYQGGMPIPMATTGMMALPSHRMQARARTMGPPTKMVGSMRVKIFTSGNDSMIYWLQVCAGAHSCLHFLLLFFRTYLRP